MKITIKELTQKHVPLLATAFARAPWRKSSSLFQQYFAEQNSNQPLVWVAFMENEVAGYVTLKWQSDYRLFREKNIPEVMDLNVLSEFRSHGLGSRLLKRAEKAAHQKYNTIGLGVGLYADYGVAQQLYVKRGYVPDGQGITYRYQPVCAGKFIPLDDDLVLW